MSPWTLLDLPGNADERSIKRQYARLLKVTRPDDDPEGFQRLREAYEQALEWARNRTDDEAGFGSTSPLALEPLHQAPPAPALQVVERVQPARDTETLARETAHPLVQNTTADNLQTQLETARQHGCEQPFEQYLLERCLDENAADAHLLKAATSGLQWLTPWQTLHLSARQEIQLTQLLLEAEDAQLQRLLANGQERAFLAALETLSREPWLAALERRDQFQRWTLLFLHSNTHWTSALFDRVCTLFGWDDRKGVFPEPEFIWRQLIERCETNAFIEHWQRQVASGKTDTLDEKVANLVLNPGRKVDQLRLARYCNADVWLACERLCSAIHHRFAHMLELFPNADVNGWRRLQVAPMNATLWTWFGWLLFGTAFMIPDAMMNGKIGLGEAPFFLLLYPIVMTFVCQGLARLWKPVAQAIEGADEWLSDRLLPQWLHWPSSQALVLRHGVPLILTGAAVSLQGHTALAAYALLMLAWIFLSPYRHPQIYASVREAIRRFVASHLRTLLCSGAVIAAGLWLSIR